MQAAEHEHTPAHRLTPKEGVSVIVAKEAGACFGVNRALDMVKEAAAKTNGPVYTLGPLIHNPLVVKDLEDKGVRVAKHVEDAEGATLLLRTHGVTPEVEEDAARHAKKLVDATCPFVGRAHRSAKELAQAGYQVLIFGEAGHPEVTGILGHAKDATVVSSAEDVAKLPLRHKVGVVVQTTQSRARLKELVASLIGRVDDIRVIDTICEATTLRQGAAAELAKQVELMVVIGGKMSANTTRLAEICASACSEVHHIESIDELEASWFAGKKAIGITAGASTPQEHIDGIYDRICEMTYL